jgi:hypothetical protein
VFRKRNSLVALCVWLAIVQGCRDRTGSSSDLTLEHEISPQPARVGPVTITLRLMDAAGTPVTGALLKLEGNMSHAGMAPVFADANETEPGRYRSTLELSMAGDWHVLVKITLPDNRKLERQFEIKGVAPV